ncbi:MAG TPA: hypothetical protein VF520_13865 [Thermoleophilaceae bacterium]
MSAQRARLDLRIPRDVGALLADGFTTYFQNFGAFLGIAAAVVLPVQLIVSGVGLEQLWSDYDATPEVAVLLLPVGVNLLVTTPLVTAMTIYALLELAEGRPPAARQAIDRGLQAFTPLLVAVLIAGVAIAASVVLIVLPIFLAVRWYFVPQAVVVEGKRGTGALSRSWELVKGSSWRVLGILFMVSLAIGGATAAIQQPLAAVAEGSTRRYRRCSGRSRRSASACPPAR